MKIYIITLLLAITVILHFREIEGNRGKPYKIVKYGPHKIKLWVDETQTRVTHADFAGNEDIYALYQRKNNYLIRTMKSENLRFVAYIKADYSLLAVSAPVPPGVSGTLEPSDTNWFIIYEGRYLQLTVDNTENPLEIHTMNQNEPHQGIEPQEATVAGITFKVFRAPGKRIVAAYLTPQQRNP